MLLIIDIEMDANNTQKEKEVKKLPPLIKKSDTYKLFVPAKVEEKIRYLIRKFPSTEWSGVLFYKHTGSFESNDLEIHCEDIFPMDLGSSGWTEFKMSEDVTRYIAENIEELFDCDLGLIHSHHMMGAFFSGQDDLMLQQEGNDTNCFVSLVVDTKGTYVAAVTRKLESESKVSIKTTKTFYEFFGDGPVNLKIDKNANGTTLFHKSVIECFNLEVQRQVVHNPFDSLDARFNEIENQKAAERTKHSSFQSFQRVNFTNTPDRDRELIQTFRKSKEEDINLPAKPKQYVNQLEKDLFDETGNKPVSPTKIDEEGVPFVDYTPSTKLIRDAVTRMLLCSLAVKPENFDMESWIENRMVNVYKKIFPDETPGKLYNAFDLWADFAVEFFVENFPDPTIPEGADPDFIRGIIATDMHMQLEPFVGSNVYVDGYLSALERYFEF